MASSPVLAEPELSCPIRAQAPGLSNLGPRCVGGLLLGLAIVCLVTGARPLWNCLNDESASVLPVTMSAALLLAAAGITASGIRVIWAPSELRDYAFLTCLLFWRWLVAGCLTMFFVVGLADLDVRYEIERGPWCRNLCAFWLAMLLLPLAAPDSWRVAAASLRRSRMFRVLDLAVGNLVVMFLVTEIVLQAWSALSQHDPLMLRRVASRLLSPGVHAHGVRANSLGFPDDEFRRERTPGVPRVAMLGDSFSVGVRVACDDNYVTLLEKRLPGVEVYNFGVIGTGPQEYRKLLHDTVWDYQPDLVVVPIFVGNDIHEWIRVPRLRKFEPEALHTLYLAQRVGKLAREWNRRQEERGGGESFLTRTFSDQSYLEFAGSRLNVCRVPETSYMHACWQRVRDDLDAIVADCRVHGVPLVLLILPSEFQVNAEVRQRCLAHRGWRDEDLDVLLPQRRLTEYCTVNKIPCLDLEPALREAGGSAYYLNDDHWNELGNRLAADAVAPWLRGGFPELLGGLSHGVP